MRVANLSLELTGSRAFQARIPCTSPFRLQRALVRLQAVMQITPLPGVHRFRLWFSRFHLRQDYGRHVDMTSRGFLFQHCSVPHEGRQQWVPLAASAFALRRDKRGFASPSAEVLRRLRGFSIADTYSLEGTERST